MQSTIVTNPSSSRQGRDYAATSILGSILAVFAIWDIYTQITTTAKDPKNIINWLNLTSSSIGVAGAIGDVINRITAQKTNAIKWAQEIKTPKLLDFEHLGILAAALNATVSAYQCYESIGQGDHAVTASLATQGLGNFVYAAEKSRRLFNAIADDSITNEINIDVGATAGENIIMDAGAEAGLAFIPFLDILDVILFASQIISFLIMLAKDNKFEHWARTSPFAKEKVTDEVTDPTKLYNNLINTVITPVITNVADKTTGGIATINFYLPSIELLKNSTFYLEAMWRLIYTIGAGRIHTAYKQAIPVKAIAKDIILLPEHRKIGKQYPATITHHEIVLLNQKAINNSPKVWLDINDNRNWYKNTVATSQIVEDLELLSRGKVTTKNVTIPLQQKVDHNKIQQDKKDPFQDDPNYIHPERKHEVNWRFSPDQMEKIAGVLRNMNQSK